MRARERCLLGRARRIFHQRVHILRQRGVMDELRQIGVMLDEGAENSFVQCLRPLRETRPRGSLAVFERLMSGLTLPFHPMGGSIWRTKR